MKKINIGKKKASLLFLLLIVLFFLAEFVLYPLIGAISYSVIYLTLGIYFYIEYDNELKKIKEDTFILVDKRYKQLEVLTSLYMSLGIDKPLPQTGGWAAFPDLLNKIKEITLSTKPKVIVEASSGVSSIILGYCLKQNGSGRVISLEHDLEYIKKSKNLINEHGLTDYVTIIHAPLKQYEIGGKKWEWYDVEMLDLTDKIDFVVVDGPPFYIQNKSRYPAIPLLIERMSKDSILILDDGNRIEEKELVADWLKENSNMTAEYLDFESGAFLIKKIKE